MRRTESPGGLVAGFPAVSELPERVSLCLPLGPFDAEELIRNRDRQQTAGRQAWNSGLLRAGVPFQLAALVW